MDPKKRVSSLKQYPVLAAFTLFFAALFVLDLVTPDRAYSELENTTLTQRPKLTAVSVDGLNNYFTNYTKYVKDQVFGRDQWIDLQSLAETTLFQKTQSGGILLGKEHRMFARRYRVLPSEDEDVISLTPAMLPSVRSSGVATVAAMVSGLAPGRLAETEMVG